MNTTQVSVDVAKSVFQIAVSHAPGRVHEQHRLSRGGFRRFFAGHEPVEVLMEACGSAHYWGRELEALGHRVSLLPPTDVSEVDFTFDPGAPENGFTMRIDSSPDAYADEGGYFATLSDLVQSFKVVYFDGEEWVEEWFSTELPYAIEFTLTLVDADEEIRPGGSARLHEIKRLIAMPQVGDVPASEGPAP